MLRKSKKQIIQSENELAELGIHDPDAARDARAYQRSFLEIAKFFEENIAVELQKKVKSAGRREKLAWLLALISVAAVCGLTPLKETVPYVLRVDNLTGASDIIRPGTDDKSSEQIDDEFALAAYVRARERYNFADNEANDKFVKLMSHDEAYVEYKNFTRSKKGYTEVLGANQMIRTDINDINFLDRKNKKGTAQVWFTKTILDRYGIPDPAMIPVQFQAVISYDYKNPPKKREDQWLNPHGFGSLSYSRTEIVGGKHD
jgi:type IV secretion system protein VirB8